MQSMKYIYKLCIYISIIIFNRSITVWNINEFLVKLYIFIFDYGKSINNMWKHAGSKLNGKVIIGYLYHQM